MCNNGAQASRLLIAAPRQFKSASSLKPLSIKIFILALSAGLLSVPDNACAYIGPGAGFAFVGSAFAFILTIGLALITILFWPFQLLLRKLRKKGVPKNSRFKRIVVVGLDGLDPGLTDKYMAAGRLPNLERLAKNGSYNRLGTTIPALSPVAWSSFQTGVNPGAHNIFDFLTRDKRNYFPVLSSTDTIEKNHSFGFGSFSFKWKKSHIQISRKSQPFWKLLGNKGIFSNIIRVPISYPPEECYGNVLSAMCTPDLKGSQGSFTFYTTDAVRLAEEQTGGIAKEFERNHDGSFGGWIEGPPAANSNQYFKTAFKIIPDNQAGSAKVIIGKQAFDIKLDEFSEWKQIEFKITKRKSVGGIVRFCLRGLTPELSLYISPVNVDPEKPALPIARPLIFAPWLAKKVGLFGTLGLMEDTWGRNEHALDDSSFLQQTYLTHNEREKMLMEMLDKTPDGLCVCVFDASDRIQHMFWRYMEDNHPSPREPDPAMQNVIPEMYAKMDQLVGRIQTKLKSDDLLIILSDHGFASFRRCININTWLAEQGLLAYKNDQPTGADYLKDVDWSRTKAFALGLSGMYINQKGREKFGIVDKKDVPELKSQIIKKLEELVDPQDQSKAIGKVYDTAKYYKGLYASDAPDLIIGYNPGYRVSWDSVTGTIEPDVFSDNLKAWSGDHHVDSRVIPGVLFTSVPATISDPHITDLAPTILNLFKVKVPAYMEGKPLL